MPFSDSELSALTSANGFTLWHYRTEDDRAAVLAPGYFAAAAPRLLPGDIVIVQAADATALVPIRGGTVPGSGVTVDGSGSTPALLRSATLLIDMMLAGAASARAIELDAPPTTLFEGDVLAVGATVTGPIAQVTFAFRTAAGTDVAPPQTVAVVGGRAAASFTAPAPAGGLRIRAADAADATLVTLSPPFAVTQPPRLVTEAGGLLLLESGAALLL
ncbi:hypothetical protein GXW74_23405 [Roseomonas eburnea]|uniref:Uncharacterized protein n=1 Tax=Neoroseomonas eburnea TaxID=1346889 RepID=A0A9X9XIB7_9PROT|nr:hypothetical protein [Neoroseomonas eburnea]MBR0683453.1 hypothetical protein [Neoroseomonas eburnea]